jgi:hypothetical protein
MVYYAASGDNFLLTLRDNLSVPSFKDNSWPFKVGPIGFLEKPVRNYYHQLRKNPEERSSYLR